MNFLQSIWTWVIGGLASAWITLRSFCLITIKLPSFFACFLLDDIRKEGKVFELEKEYVAHRLPSVYKCYAFYKGVPFYFEISSSKDLKNQEGDDFHGTLIAPRWWYLKVLPEAKTKLFEHSIPRKAAIYIVREWSSEKIGTMDTDRTIVPYLNPSVYSKLETDINEVIEGKKKKVGVLLHGLPGNGKSYLIRYFAIKYNLPVYIFAMYRELNNVSVIRMFNNIKGPGIVLFEDFDTYFNKRECLLEKEDFTFDTLLNGIDGLYTDNGGLIFAMTTNCIDKIDESLKERPSRFKYILEIKNPDIEIRKRICDNPEFLIKTENKTLDQTLDVFDKEFRKE